MANNLARIFGTEEDKVNCSFYFKIGACRHGERCSRLHMKPNFSQTLLLAHFYMPPAPGKDGKVVDDSEHYEDFYEDVLDEMIKYGDVEELVICENLGDHMFGNTYVKFATEEQAHKALINLRGRYYCGRIVQAEYSPVTDFREGRCRQFDEHNCLRGGYCNFLHLKPVPRFARRYLRRIRLKNRYRHPYGLNYQKRHRSDDWPRFPIRGNSEERRRCIAKWNKLLKEQREREKRKKEKLAKKKERKQKEKERKEKEKKEREKKEQQENNNNDDDNDDNDDGDGDKKGDDENKEIKDEDDDKKMEEKEVKDEDGDSKMMGDIDNDENGGFNQGSTYMNPERLKMLNGQ